uniref:DNA mismatch repair protein n=1 Tax=Parastrongyloides trichosuri TaxID=131310 RepID=A0A0N4ZMM9_PARTI
MVCLLSYEIIPFFILDGTQKTPSRIALSKTRDFDSSFSNSISVKRKRENTNEESDESPVKSSKSTQKRRRVYIESDSDFELDAEEKEDTPEKESEKLKTPKLSRAFSKTNINIKRKNLLSDLDKEYYKADLTDVKNIDIDTVGEDRKEKDYNFLSKKSLKIKGDDFPHLNFKFLKPENIKDINGRRPDDPEYDCKTLYVPPDFLKEQTPGHKQWWTIKSKNFDTVLLFKIGKFYELYHMDAIIGHEQLGLIYMRGSYAHSGFPELSYGRYADQLISLGYKVARIEQTETPQMLSERCKKERIKEKVVSREVCQISSIATQMFTPIEESRRRIVDDKGEERFLMAISMTYQRRDIYSFGVCFINTSVGKFYFSQFEDDPVNSNLRTLLSHFQPSQLLLEKTTPKKMLSMLTSILPSTQFEYLVPKKEFFYPDKTLYELTADIYFGGKIEEWPDLFKKLLSDCNSPIPKVNDNYFDCVKSFGAIMFYLQRFLIDVDMISMKNFVYTNPKNSSDESLNCQKEGRNNYWEKRILIIDGSVIYQLSLLPPLKTIGVKNSSNTLSENKINLYEVINNCNTSFGKRLLKKWICAPTCDPNELVGRQKSISLFCDSENTDLCEDLGKKLKSLPDLEKFLQKNHCNASKYRKEQHPDGRAIMFDQKLYDKKKIIDFVTMIRGFGIIIEIVNLLKESNILEDDSSLKEMFDGDFDFSQKEIDSFTESFDQDQALKEGMIVPTPGVDSDFDEAVERVKVCEQNLNKYLEELMCKIRCPKLKYIKSGKNRYHIEVPDSDVKKLPSDFNSQGKIKGWQRFTSTKSLELVGELTKAEQNKELVRSDISRKIYYAFDVKREKWYNGVRKMSYLDCLLSLSIYSLTSGLEMTMPEFDFTSTEPYINISQGNHPLLAMNLNSLTKFNSTTSYIPNDTVIGKEKGNVMLMTGPNMGGKSTLMRQTATLVILAQMGSMVPANNMKLTPVDRIFTRIGSSDKICGGESTFAVELNETNLILTGATRHSLVIIDELGRGTGTTDGLAIAASALEYCASKVKCRTIFSTHFHSLCDYFKDRKDIFLAHMACVNDSDTTDPTEANITFLYTLNDGCCTQSYGFYVAKLAGIGDKFCKKAYAAGLRLTTLN